MRERLIELVKYIDGAFYCGANAEEIADALLDEGVILLPCKVGDTVYRIVGANSLTPYIYDWQITEIRVYQDEIVCIDDSGNPVFVDEIGKTVFLTKSQAEDVLKNEQKKL